ncbi:type II toxin-antitoxin system RelE/ParE family toxin [Marinobacter sp. ATCH36]|uniref:type II toxin-antitoxin system RelE/ParE family toxin n=1 Tax=Marinobacter sp. ATCH36 TaxID=2945106 RepID=UPI002020FC24|nr:type II toxin-antitoxin system RelE/ParE family toxin [Marinobacter sp. ATCH36]MCL7945128.1 type II toxin-antitoxin system RelE/ParE family toxin [Marinobacter sp. ATCH36]
MVNYRLSKRADEDFESVYLFGLLNFGLRQADAYADGLEKRFEQIAAQPDLYPAIEHIKPGFRFSVYQSHSIYYRIDQTGVLIVRILRNQDVGAAL